MKSKILKLNFKKKIATFLCFAMLISNSNIVTMYANDDVQQIETVISDEIITTNETTEESTTSEAASIENADEASEVIAEKITSDNAPIGNAIVEVAPTTIPIEATNANIILKGNGWFESAYVNWAHDGSFDSYNVYYKTSSADDSTYVKIDAPLVRPDTKNGGYRADVLGLPGGITYTIKVVPVLSSAEVTASAKTISVTPKSYDRTGYAFSSESPNGTTNGAYLDDGRVNPAATIIYITNDNVNDNITIGSKTDWGGLGKVFPANTNVDSRNYPPLIIRFIGQVGNVTVKSGTTNEVAAKTDVVVPNGLNSNTYQLDVQKGSNITFEGVGDDARLEGWGLNLYRTKNVVVRNLDFGLYVEDAISINGATSNTSETGTSNNTWITNCKFNIGLNAYKAGFSNESDKQYGDGATDTTNGANYFTLSYNHYNGTHKSQLDGGSPTNAPVHYGTYHHNYYDATASRNPRIRGGSIHSFNNYFSGVTGYGIGITTYASVLAQNNYFENMQRPIITSGKGNESGTLSGDPAGASKQDGNIFNNVSKWDPNTDVGMYTTWDTKLDNLTYACTMDSADDAKENVLAYAGIQRYNVSGSIPNPVTNLAVRINDDEKYALTWSAVDNVEHYKVYSSTDGSSYTLLDTTNSPNYTSTNSAVANSTVSFKVLASNSFGDSQASNIVSISYNTPNAPTNLVVTPNKNTLKLDWTASTTANSTYEVTVTGTSYNQTFTTPDTTLNIDTLANGVYNISIKAVNGKLSSTTSLTGTGTVAYYDVTGVTPNTSTTLPYTGSTSETVTVTGVNLSSSNVYLSKDNGATKITPASVDGTTATFNLTIAPNDTTSAVTNKYDVYLNNTKTSYSATYVIEGKPSASAITPISKSISYLGATESITVTGTKLTKTNIYITTDNGATKTYPTTVATDGTSATFSVIIAPNNTYTATSVVYNVVLVGNSTSLTSTFNVAGKSLPTVKSISPTSFTFSYTGGTKALTVTGTDISTQNVTLVNNGNTISPSSSSSDGTTVTFNVTVPANSTLSDVVYNYDVYLSGAKSNLTSVITVSAKPVPTVKLINPSAYTFNYLGGTKSLTVTGSDITTQNVTLVNDGNVISPTSSNSDATSVTFNVTVPANYSTEADVLHNFDVYLDGAKSNLTSVITVSAKPIPKVNSITPSSLSLSYIGGSKTLTVHGSNITAKNVTLVTNDGTIISPVSASNGETTVTFNINIPSNSTQESIVYNYDVYLDGVKSDLTSTITVGYKSTNTGNNSNNNNSNSNGGGSSINKNPIISDKPATTTDTTTDTNTDTSTGTTTTYTEGALTANTGNADVSLEISKSEISDSAKETLSSYNEKNEKLIDSTASTISAKDANGSDVSKTTDSLKFSYDLSNVELTTDEQKDLVCVNVDADGNISYLGGIFNEETNQYYVETKIAGGDFAVILADPTLYNQVTLQVNSTDYEVNRDNGTMETAPKIVNDTTFVPIRLVLEALGADVDFDAVSKTAIISLDGNQVNLQVGDQKDGNNAPFIENGRMLVPLRVIAESFDANVIWQPITKEIQITK